VFALRSYPARADGAFPDSIGILLPSDQLNKIIAATNFGLLVSDDNGASWAWVCEEAIGLNAFIYQQGAAPNDLLLAVTLDGLKYSSDFGCTWNRSGGTVSSVYVYDAFPDPVAALHAYALVRRSLPDGGVYEQLHDSLDGDQTFGLPLFTSPPGPQNHYLSGVENARSRAQRLYLTAYDRTPVHPYLHRSDDDGGTWQQADLAPAPGSALQGYTVLLIAVDPVNENRIYLRLIDSVTGHERLGIYDDSSATVRVTLDLTYRMNAFLRRSDGALIVATSDGQAFISTDQGATFTSLANPPHIRALGERAGIIYAVTDNFLDGYAVARSMDQGVTWQALVRYEQLTGPKHCGNLEAICAVPWQTLQATLRGALDGGNPDAGPPPTNHSGCTQSPSNEGLPWPFSIVGPLIVAIGLLAIRRKPR